MSCAPESICSPRKNCVIRQALVLHLQRPASTIGDELALWTALLLHVIILNGSEIYVATNSIVRVNSNVFLPSGTLRKGYKSDCAMGAEDFLRNIGVRYPKSIHIQMKINAAPRTLNGNLIHYCERLLVGRRFSIEVEKENHGRVLLEANPREICFQSNIIISIDSAFGPQIY
ncbi:hypothetical protein EAE96_007565 [Botrytis aclada]|nr:hypothetical protein EAE96_007565 [Botrytis aclada]